MSRPVVCSTLCTIGGCAHLERRVMVMGEDSEWRSATDSRVRYLTMGSPGQFESLDLATGRRNQYAVIGRTQRGEVLAISV